MASIQESIDVQVPLSTVYNQWTQFEEFPQFMEGVKSVSQLDDTHLRWVAEAGGQEHKWTAEITEQHPDERVAWKAIEGHGNSGVVTFHRLGEGETRVTVQMEHETEGMMKSLGARSAPTRAACRATSSGSRTSSKAAASRAARGGARSSRAGRSASPRQTVGAGRTPTGRRPSPSGYSASALAGSAGEPAQRSS